jgi:hypothetical protein
MITMSSGTGVQYNTTAAGSATGNIINFQAGGGGSRTGIDVNTDAAPLIQNNQINDDPTQADTGIALDISSVSAVQVLNNTICATGSDIPLRVSPGFFGTAALAQVSGTTLSCGLAGGMGLQGTLSSGNATLRAVGGQTAFRLTSTVSVSSGAQLTIPAGFSLDGQNRSMSISGMLQATSAQFTNVAFSFNSGSGGSIANNTINGPAFSTAISINDASPSFTGNTFQGMGTAISLDGLEKKVSRPRTVSGDIAV